jgi:hypothetical protein
LSRFDACGIDDHEPLVELDDVRVAAAAAVQTREARPRRIPRHLVCWAAAAFATASPTVFINCVAMPPASPSCAFVSTMTPTLASRSISVL